MRKVADAHRGRLFRVSLVFLLLMIPRLGHAQSSFTLNFDVENEEAVATGLTWTNFIIGFVDTLTIPDTYTFEGTNYPVTRVRQDEAWAGVGEVIFPDSVVDIAAETFAYRNSLTNVVFGNGLTNIGNGAFAYCANLQRIVLPDSLQSLGDAVFSGSGLQSVELADGLRLLSSFTFEGCTSLTTVSFGSGLERIGSAAFGGCSALSDVILPDSVQVIEGFAFGQCSALTNLYLGANLTSIGHQAFSSCASLPYVVIPPSVTNMETMAFSSCSGLTNVSMSLQTIPDRTFWRCSALEGITFQDGLENIGVGAFENCTSLTEINVPDSVLTIGASAFAGCAAVTNATLPSRFAAQVGTIGFSGDLATRLMADGLVEAIAQRIVDAVAENNFGIALKSELGPGGDLTQAIQTILANPGEYGLYDGEAITNQYDQGFATGVGVGETNVLADPASFSLYDENSILDLRFGGLMLSKTGETVEVEFDVEQTENLQQTNAWTVIGSHTNSVSDISGKSFIRIRAKDPSQSAP